MNADRDNGLDSPLPIPASGMEDASPPANVPFVKV